uniref:beta-ketoacyl reductase n=1 Tax=Actinoplanes sp. RD1 TaxID=3064538 RepID=UPI00274177F0
PDAARVLQTLRERGVRADYTAIDVADRRGLRSLLAERDSAGLPAVRGLFHAAGVIDYQPLTELTAADIHRVTHAKIDGGWALHDVLGGRPMDMFVLFSSGSALLGSPLLGVYAAGNAFLDALAAYRRGNGLPATTVNWGFWERVGMVARHQQQQDRSLTPRGMRAFSPEDGLAVLERILVHGIEQVAVLPADWQQWAQAYPVAAAAPLVREVVAAPSASVPAPGVRPTPPAVSEPAAAAAPQPAPAAASAPAPQPAPAAAAASQSAPVPPPAASGEHSALLQGLTAQAAQVLGQRPDRIAAGRPLKAMGMDSLMAVEFRNRVAREFGWNLPVVDILNGVSLEQIARSAAAGSAGIPAPVSAPPAAPVQPAPATLPAPAPVAPPPAAMAVSAGPSPAPRDSAPPPDTGDEHGDVLPRLLSQAAQVLGQRPERIATGRPLKAMGMDSLMAVEFRNRVDREFGWKLPVVDILNGATLDRIATSIAAARTGSTA